MLRRLFALAFAVIALTFGAAAAPATADHRTLTFPDRLELPDGFWPEGIAIGRGPTAWVGSLVDGDIYRLDLRTGRGEVAIEGPGTGAVGLALDHQGRLFVSGGFAGDARVYDVHSGDLLASYSFADAPTVVNDVTLTRRAAYFTDSSNPTLYVVPLGRNGQPPADEDKFFRLELSGDWVQMPGAEDINANGITRTPDGRALLVGNTATGNLYRVDPKSGHADVVDLVDRDGRDVSVPGADGLLLLGRTLYVAQSFPDDQVSKFRVNPDGTRGRLLEVITHPDFDDPTTLAAFGKWLYLPNARFTTPVAPDVEYWVTRIDQ